MRNSSLIAQTELRKYPISASMRLYVDIMMKYTEADINVFRVMLIKQISDCSCNKYKHDFVIMDLYYLQYDQSQY